jgi:large subunit ribosomal protein L13
MQTYFAKKEEYAAGRPWYHVDATGKIVGRLATAIATVLTGKDRPTYTPHVDTGAYVVVTNAEKVVFTGKKREQKVYRHYTGFHGGLREVTAEDRLAKHPERVLKEAVRRMLPKSKLGDTMLKKLKVYAGPDHPHTYHKPEELSI